MVKYPRDHFQVEFNGTVNVPLVTTTLKLDINDSFVKSCKNLFKCRDNTKNEGSKKPKIGFHHLKIRN